MFKNSLSEKMPCWECTRDHVKCKIIDGLSKLPMEVNNNIMHLTFDCGKMLRK